MVAGEKSRGRLHMGAGYAVHVGTQTERERGHVEPILPRKHPDLLQVEFVSEQFMNGFIGESTTPG